jgi:hypothetical protein
MALTLHVPDENPKTGVSGMDTKPITEGERRIAVPEQQRKTGFWGALDDLGTTVVNGVSNVAGAIAQREVDELVTGPESSVTSEGNPDDQPGGVTVNQKTEQPFYVKYQTELLIGGGVLAAMVVLFVVTRD